MANWRDTILDEFVPHVSKLTLVADPDNLLTEEKLALALRQRGFDLIEFDDPIAFRYAYESHYRSIWDQGQKTNLVVILRVGDGELESLPYDLLQVGRRLSFSLGSIFPNFSYPVIEALDRSLLDQLFEAQQKHQPQRLGDNATVDLILRYVFGIDIDAIDDDVSLLQFLLQHHYKRAAMPDLLRNRLIEKLSETKRFQEWALEDLVSDQQAFLLFLQERWPLFLNTLEGITKLGDSATLPMAQRGPALLPFDHQDILVYIDNLFIEGRLNPVRLKKMPQEVAHWIRSGIVTNEAADIEERISRLLEWATKNLPEKESRHTEWIDFSQIWAQLSALVHCQPKATSNQIHQQSQYLSTAYKVNELFEKWLLANFASLLNRSPTRPTMLHVVPRYLARQMEDDPARRVALLVVDGLAFDQWITLKQVLLSKDATLSIDESATFAWVPTVTSVSRQTIFSGKMPLYFADSINTTNQEEKQWQLFWQEQGLSKGEIAYKRSLGDGNAVDAIEDVFIPGRTKVIGLVIDKVDKIMHGMELGASGMHNQIKQWAEDGYLAALISYLLDLEYDIWLTADHGNIEADGRGRPQEQSIANTRGQRVRVYPTPELRSRVADEFNFAHAWEPTGLPNEFFPLVASGKNAFGKLGDKIVAHGGISLEEVIVPWIHIEKTSTRPAQ